jgi:hypothetical protein
MATVLQSSRQPWFPALRVAAIAVIGLFMTESVMAQPTKWNEVPAPTGKEVLSHLYKEGYRTDVIDVPIKGNDGDLEYKIHMKAGATVVYSWEVLNIKDPEEFYTEFHGHTEQPAGQPGDLMFYDKSTGSKASGSLIAPWTGIHGWYWQNQGVAPVVVRLRVSGFYEIVPGQAGRPVKE